MGGLVSRYYIEKMGGRDDVGKLIMVQTPNHGSEWVDLRVLIEYVGYVNDIRSVHKIISKYGVNAQASEIIKEFFHRYVTFWQRLVLRNTILSHQVR